MQENQNTNIQIANEQTSIQEPMNDVLGADETIDYNEPQQQIKTKIVETTKKEGLLSRTWNGISTAFTIGTAATAGYLANLFGKNKKDTLQNTVVNSTVKVTGICVKMAHENSKFDLYTIAKEIQRQCYNYGINRISKALCYVGKGGAFHDGTYDYCYKNDTEINDEVKGMTESIISNACYNAYNTTVNLLGELYTAEKTDCTTKEKNVAYNVDIAFRTMLNSSFEMYKTAYKKIEGLNLIIESGHDITLTLAIINSVWAGMNIVKGGLHGLTLLKNKFSPKNRQQNIQNAIAEVNNQIDRNNTIL